MHKIFTYGTLKRGHGNNALLQRAGAEFLCETFTKHSVYDMISLGGFPGVYKNGSYSIQGHLFLVDDIGLAACDRLESNGSLYQRELVKLQNGDEAWMYIFLPQYDRNSIGNIRCCVDNESNLVYLRWK